MAIWWDIKADISCLAYPYVINDSLFVTLLFVGKCLIVDTRWRPIPHVIPLIINCFWFSPTPTPTLQPHAPVIASGYTYIAASVLCSSQVITSGSHTYIYCNITPSHHSLVIACGYIYIITTSDTCSLLQTCDRHLWVSYAVSRTHHVRLHWMFF